MEEKWGSKTLKKIKRKLMEKIWRTQLVLKVSEDL